MKNKHRKHPKLSIFVDYVPQYDACDVNSPVPVGNFLGYLWILQIKCGYGTIGINGYPVKPTKREIRRRLKQAKKDCNW
ncbi:hypothetical protein CHOED_027 [Vibrio phage CHOED]|uniref:hypothetical protein n=1 Tax=Vibrio phage CHOED TaxID=1458716 RepID=UPI00042E47EC|nr:hypothetical protein CHOED_027 [Vibrio phage CHOED]AHK11887.1 hypothetical protein CHOED_027 [Vibrio phage CHOED]